MKHSDLNLGFPRSNTKMPAAVANHFRQMGVQAADLAEATSHSLCDGDQEVALIYRAGGFIALVDRDRSAIRFYDRSARPLLSQAAESTD